MKRTATKIKVVEAYEASDSQIHAVVDSGDGTMTVIVPDWADNSDIKQEAARLIELAKAKSVKKRVKALED